MILFDCQLDTPADQSERVTELNSWKTQKQKNNFDWQAQYRLSILQGEFLFITQNTWFYWVVLFF